MADRPTVDEICARLSVPAGNPMVAEMRLAAIGQQDSDCLTDPFTDQLREALFRRTANLWASKAHTLGILDTGLDLGVAYVPRYDPVIDSLEGPFRRIPVA